MSLYDELTGIPETEWRYYRGINFSGYEKAIADPLGFIASYFYYAGKNKFLYESLFDFRQKNCNEQNKRSTHTVNAFFLGLYLKEKIEYLKPHKNSFLSKDKNFMWAWFLCSLYHDAFFEIDESLIPSYKYAIFSKGILYDSDLISRYYEKENNPKTSHDQKKNKDHGIIAAERMYCNYTNMIEEVLSWQGKEFKNFVIDEELEYSGLKINNSTFRAMCKVAKIIACHNIFVSKKKDVRYKNLPELIKENKQFRYMPNTKNRREISSYEKLYFLMALVDTLEPSKRGIDLKNIDIRVDKIQSNKYRVSIDLSKIQGEYDRYYNGISDLGSWLNFVETNEDGKKIHIDFNINKNR